MRPSAADKQGAIKTLIHEFQYPWRGPGMMWQRFRDRVEQPGCEVVFDAPVEKIHWDPGRVKNYRNWSPQMVPDPRKTCLGLEYFCFEGDDLWTMSEEDLMELGLREMDHLGPANRERYVDGTIVRMPKAYPVYDGTYRRGIERIRRFLDGVPNLQVIGRDGMHHNNNQGHSMLTGVLAARNILGGTHDLWSVNVDAEYHEEGSDGSGSEIEKLSVTQPLVPRRME